MRSKWFEEILGPSKSEGHMGSVVGSFVDRIGAKIDNLSNWVEVKKQREKQRQARRKLYKILEKDFS